MYLLVQKCMKACLSQDEQHTQQCQHLEETNSDFTGCKDHITSTAQHPLYIFVNVEHVRLIYESIFPRGFRFINIKFHTLLPLNILLLKIKVLYMVPSRTFNNHGTFQLHKKFIRSFTFYTLFGELKKFSYGITGKTTFGNLYF